MYLEVLNLCLHQPLKCISQNSSARTSLLLFPQFSSFHVVGKKTQSPLLILRQGKSKHTKINKAVNHPLSPCHHIPIKPPRQKVSAEGSGPAGRVPQSPPWRLLTSPSSQSWVPGDHRQVSPCTTPFSWQGSSLAAGSGPTDPHSDGNTGLSPRGLSSSQ